MEKQNENEVTEKKSKKSFKESVFLKKETFAHPELAEVKTIKITFEGQAAKKLLKCESELKERLSKPDMGKILGSEILAWSEKRWGEIIEENTDIDYFFAQIRKCTDRSKSIKLLKALSEKLKAESSDGLGEIGVNSNLEIPIVLTGDQSVQN